MTSSRSGDEPDRANNKAQDPETESTRSSSRLNRKGLPNYLRDSTATGSAAATTQRGPNVGTSSSARSGERTASSQTRLPDWLIKGNQRCVSRPLAPPTIQVIQGKADGRTRFAWYMFVFACLVVFILSYHPVKRRVAQRFGATDGQPATGISARPMGPASEPIRWPQVDLTGSYGDKWREVAEAAAAFSVTEIRRSAEDSDSAVIGLECRQSQQRLDVAVRSLIAAQPPPTLFRFDWEVRPLFEELVAAEKTVCDGVSSNDPTRVSQGWVWIDSIRTTLSKTLATF
jgi:hypothetical protein